MTTYLHAQRDVARLTCHSGDCEGVSTLIFSVKGKMNTATLNVIISIHFHYI